MKKTKLMIITEQKIGEGIESYLLRKYNEEFLSSVYIGRELGVSYATVRRWLPRFNIKIREEKSYLEKRIKYPTKGALSYYYNYLRTPIRKIASERRVCPKTVYRWMEKECIERRHGTDAFLKNGLEKPTDEELEKLLEEKKRKEIALIYGVWPETIDRWRINARLFKPEKSKYDRKIIRKKALDEIISMTGKQISELSSRDFHLKQKNGNSYRGLLYWYFSHFGYNFNQIKNHLIKEVYSDK